MKALNYKVRKPQIIDQNITRAHDFLINPNHAT